TDRAAQPVDEATIARVVAALTDWRKLDASAVDDHAIADRYEKLVYWLALATNAGVDAQLLLRQALEKSETPPERSALVEEMFFRSFDHALAEQWLTAENLDRMRKGE